MRPHSLPLIPTLIPASLLLASACTLYTGQDPPPPGQPITGGTLIIAADGHTAYASDPERDKVYVIDLSRGEISKTIALNGGDHPGRLVEDGAGRVHVALRGTGDIVTIADGAVVDRQSVCAAPRGLAYQATGDLVHVACSTGELVSLPAAGGAPVRTVVLDRDLRDVVVHGDELEVTRFRTAEVLRVAADGTIASRLKPATVQKNVFDEFGGATTADAVPAVAWRTVPLADGRIMVAHERATRTVLNTQEPDGYSGGGCFDGPIEATVSIIDPTSDAVYANRRFTTVQLPVDIAVSPDGADLAVVNAGFRTVRVARMATLPMVEGSGDGDCGGGDDGDEDIAPESAQWGAPTAAAYAPDGRLVIQWDNVIQIRNPRTFEPGTAIALPGPAVLDGGRARFHTPTAAGIACASCHPEGLDDGLVWSFDFGDRRSQNISGNLEHRAPYHWSGDMTDLNMLMDEVLVHRMGGEEPTADQRDELTQFLFNLKPPPSPTYLDPAAVARGKALFENDDVGCAHCHSGPLFTDNSMRDVGTGGNFKVPSLVGVAWRPPFIHTGCAKTLRDRFDPACGGDRHGGADTLTDAQLDDLITYLQSL